MHQYLNFIYSLLIQISKVYFLQNTVNGRVTGSVLSLTGCYILNIVQVIIWCLENQI